MESPFTTAGLRMGMYQPGPRGPAGAGYSAQPGYSYQPQAYQPQAYPQGFESGYPQKAGFVPGPTRSMVRPAGRYQVEHLGQKKYHMADLHSAREEMQLHMFHDTFWCCYGWCCGLGCLGPFREGCCVSIGQLCCCAGTCRDAVCWDEDGYVASTIKICCCVWHSEIPPSMTPGCGCAGCYYCGYMPPPNILEMDPTALTPNEREEYEILMSTCWCPFLYCCGIGCNPPGGNEPCFKVEGKLCCLWSNCETDDSYEEAIGCTEKCCCIVLDASCPAGRTPGCGCCNILCGGNLHEHAAGLPGGPAQLEMAPYMR